VDAPSQPPFGSADGAGASKGRGSGGSEAASASSSAKASGGGGDEAGICDKAYDQAGEIEADQKRKLP